MTCPRPLCGQPMAVDREFEVEAVAHGVPKRRWTDLRGHEVIEEVPREPIGRDVKDPILLPRACRLCSRMITSPSHASQQYHVLCGQAKAEGMRVSKQMTRQPCCRRGHRFTEKNTYIDPQGHRQCVTCRRVHDAARAQHRTRRSA